MLGNVCLGGSSQARLLLLLLLVFVILVDNPRSTMGWVGISFDQLALFFRCTAADVTAAAAADVPRIGSGVRVGGVRSADDRAGGGGPSEMSTTASSPSSKNRTSVFLGLEAWCIGETTHGRVA